MHQMARKGRRFCWLITAIVLVGGFAPSVFSQTATNLSQIMPLVRPVAGKPSDGTLPKGTLKLTIKKQTQSFVVEAYNLADSYPNGLAVYLGTAPQITNGVLHYVDVMDFRTNGYWRLAFTSSPQAPPQLGVTNLTDLVGMTIFVASDTNKALLRAFIVDLVPHPEQFSFRRRVALTQPPLRLSLKASGSTLVSYNGRTGASYIETRAIRLNAGNNYTSGGSVSNCMQNGYPARNGTVVWRINTGLGDDFPLVKLDGETVLGTDVGATTVYDLVGLRVDIRDCYNGVHLLGAIPHRR